MTDETTHTSQADHPAATVSDLEQHQEIIPSQTGSYVKTVFMVPTPLGYTLLGGLIFAIFALFTITGLLNGAERDRHTDQVNSAIRNYGLQLDNFQTQISAYENCTRASTGRDDLREAFLSLANGLIDTAERAGGHKVAQEITGTRDKFDSDYPPIPLASCKVPEVPERPPIIPDDIPFVVPTLPTVPTN